MPTSARSHAGGLTTTQGLEVGRDALPELQDPSLAMPWNVSASLRGSRQGSSAQGGRGTTPGSFGGFASSVAGGRASSVLSGVGSRSRQPHRAGGQMPSSSPMGGRGRPSSDLIRLSSLELPDENEAALGEEDGDRDGNHFAGLPAAASAATTSQAVRAALDRESLNFLDYLRENLDDVQQQQDDDLPGEEDPPTSTVMFDQLLHPEQNSTMVAAQGFYHIRSLATKGLVEVVQQIAYGGITIVPVPDRSKI